MENTIVKRQQGADFCKALLAVGGYEIFGTAMLVFAINASTNNPFGIALILFEAILIAGPVCGAHFNPAVTLAVFIMNYKSWKENTGWVLFYWACQITGAMLGVGIVIAGLGNGWTLKTFAILKPAENMTNPDIFFVEWVCTTFFIWIISLGKEGRVAPDLSTDGMLTKLTVGLTLAAMIFIAGPHTGGCFNPAVGVSQTVLAVTQLDDGTIVADYTWIYICAPFLGGFTAGLAALMHAKFHFWLAVEEKVKKQRTLQGEQLINATEGSVD
jgi:glycerol uptake facilitator protein